jgi:hypothetical protein
MKALPGRLPYEDETGNGNVVLWEFPFHALLPSVRKGSTIRKEFYGCPTEKFYPDGKLKQ